MAFLETGGIVSCRKDIPFQILMCLMFSCWAAIRGKETVREGVQKPAEVMNDGKRASVFTCAKSK